MKKARVIARLDIKGENLIKGVQLEGLRVLGKPSEFARKYYEDGIDELIYSDVVASLYGRNSLHDVIKATASETFVPLTVGGGVRSTADVSDLLSVGADKISINTAAVRNSQLITDIANQFGSQCCVIEVQAKKYGSNDWRVMVDNGREPTGLSATEWTQQAVAFGAGEVLLTSIDRDGTRSGVDKELISAVAKLVTVPVIASGGVGRPRDAAEAFNATNLHAIAIADLLHYGRFSVADVKQAMVEQGLGVRI